MSQTIAFIVDAATLTGKVVFLALFTVYVILQIVFDALFLESVKVYSYIFGANHTAALVVFSTMCIITLLAYDKLLTIETNMSLFRQLQKRVAELEEQNVLLKKALIYQSEDVKLSYMRLYKELEVNELKRDTSIKSLSSKLQRVERVMKQYI